MMATVGISAANEILHAAGKTLMLYNDVLDHFIPWKQFIDTMDKLKGYSKHYSDAAGEIIGKIVKLMLDSHDHYLTSTRLVYEWCSLAKPLLIGYMSLFTDYSKEKAAVQKNILLEVLTSGIEKMDKAQESLGASSSSFNDAAGHLAQLNVVLGKDLDRNSTFFLEECNNHRTKAYAYSSFGGFLGIVGLIIAYSIAASIVEGSQIPAMEAEMEKVKQEFKNLSETVKKCQVDITDVKQKLQEEIDVISDLKVQTEETKFWVEQDDAMINELKASTDKLVTMCDAYQKLHETKKD